MTKVPSNKLPWTSAERSSKLRPTPSFSFKQNDFLTITILAFQLPLSVTLFGRVSTGNFLV